MILRGSGMDSLRRRIGVEVYVSLDEDLAHQVLLGTTVFAGSSATDSYNTTFMIYTDTQDISFILISDRERRIPSSSPSMYTYYAIPTPLVCATNYSTPKSTIKPT